ERRVDAVAEDPDEQEGEARADEGHRESQAAHESRSLPARASAVNWSSGGAVCTAAVGARLRAVPADLHRAPGGRPVARVVVERPAASHVAAALEPWPG